MDKELVERFLQTKTKDDFFKLAAEHCDYTELGYVFPAIVGEHFRALNKTPPEEADPDIYYDPPYVFGDTSATDK